MLQGRGYFPVRRPREWHQTEGFREEAVCLEASRRSYRETAAHLNRYRRQWQEGTPVTTLQATAQREGTRVLDFLERHSQAILQAHGVDAQGQPSAAVVTQVVAGSDPRLSAEALERGLATTGQEMQARGFTPAQIAAVEAAAATAVHEELTECTYLYIDDVEVKKQKAHRDGNRSAEAEPTPTEAPLPSGRQRPKVANTIARLERGQKRFTLSGGGVQQVLHLVLAFLLNNALLSGRLQIFTDGYKGLQNAIATFFAWHPRVWLLLDWYHLVKKFKEDLSLACRGRALRNQHLRALVRLLWYGLVTEAQQYLAAIPVDDLKDPAAIERLRKYLLRNQGAIPCYALRRHLGLRNASSPVESANNELTARRQKHNGMSWSEPGSHALAALNMLVSNRCHETWVRKHTIPFAFVDKAA